jgi:tRNA(adenine34) deaminase
VAIGRWQAASCRDAAALKVTSGYGVHELMLQLCCSCISLLIKLPALDIIENSDIRFMQEAIKEARKAFERDEVPVGALIVCRNRIIARAHNLTETLTDVTAHAEMQAYTAASNHLGGKYLHDCTLYVTLEPCLMCAGASFWTHIGRIVYGAADPKRGYHLFAPNALHPKTEICGGILEAECAEMLQEFFKKKRL